MGLFDALFNRRLRRREREVAEAQRAAETHGTAPRTMSELAYDSDIVRRPIVGMTPIERRAAELRAQRNTSRYTTPAATPARKRPASSSGSRFSSDSGAAWGAYTSSSSSSSDCGSSSSSSSYDGGSSSSSCDTSSF